MILRTSYQRNPNIGIFSAANDSYAILSRTCPADFKESVERTLQVETVSTNISGTTLIGVFLAMNNSGVLLPRNAYSEERKVMEDAGLKTGVCPDKYTALGNLVLVNGNGAVVSQNFSGESLKVMEDVFDCEVERMAMRSYTTLGSIGVVTDKGGIIHPMVSDEEAGRIREVLKVDIEAGTVNRGIGFIRTGAIANSKGVMVGQDTTGPEITRIQDALGLL